MNTVDLLSVSAAVREAAERMTASLRKMQEHIRDNMSDTSYAARERTRENMLQKRIEAERKIGLDFVQAEAARVRKELGL